MSPAPEWATISYVAPLESERDVLRVRLRIERGEVVRLTIQYEVAIDDRYLAVVRYDSAHGGAHRDMLNRDGRNVEKMWFVGQRYADVVNAAITDINLHWRDYRRQVLRRNP